MRHAKYLMKKEAIVKILEKYPLSTVYRMHKHTKWYKGLSEEIKKNVVPKLQLDERTKVKKATVV